MTFQRDSRIISSPILENSTENKIMQELPRMSSSALYYSVFYNTLLSRQCELKALTETLVSLAYLWTFLQPILSALLISELRNWGVFSHNGCIQPCANSSALFVSVFLYVEYFNECLNFLVYTSILKWIVILQDFQTQFKTFSFKQVSFAAQPNLTSRTIYFILQL